MSADVIDKIKAAENEALAIRQAALEAVREKVAQARRQAACIMERASKDADASANGIKNEASVRASGIAAAAAAEAAKEAARISAETEPKLEAAALIIVERILK